MQQAIRFDLSVDDIQSDVEPKKKSLGSKKKKKPNKSNIHICLSKWQETVLGQGLELSNESVTAAYSFEQGWIRLGEQGEYRWKMMHPDLFENQAGESRDEFIVATSWSLLHDRVKLLFMCTCVKRLKRMNVSTRTLFHTELLKALEIMIGESMIQLATKCHQTSSSSSSSSSNIVEFSFYQPVSDPLLCTWIKQIKFSPLHSKYPGFEKFTSVVQSLVRWSETLENLNESYEKTPMSVSSLCELFYGRQLVKQMDLDARIEQLKLLKPQLEEIRSKLVENQFSETKQNVPESQVEDLLTKGYNIWQAAENVHSTIQDWREWIFSS